MNIDRAVEMIVRDETETEHKKRIEKLRKLSIERDFLEDAIELLKDVARYADITEKRQRRLDRVNAQIAELS